MTTPLQPEATLRRYRGDYASHAHAHAQVLVGRQGHLELEVDGRPAFVDASSAVIVPAGAAHAYLARHTAEVLVIDAPPIGTLDRMRRFKPPPHWREAGAAVDVRRALAEIGATPLLLARRRLALADLNDALAGRLHERWDSARLAALFHLSVQRFRPRFIELAGTTPGDYLRARRLDEAERLLRAGLSLEAAALQAGYGSASALGVALKRERGSGARALRR